MNNDLTNEITQSVHFSSKTDLWETPQDLFDRLHAIHRFTLDVCATIDNAKCHKFYTPKMDGLAQDWKDNVCWMNPPYGREIGKWVKKAYEATFMDWQHTGAKVVCLLPARTDTKWWHDYVKPYGKVEFIKGRLKFGGHKNSAPFPSAIIIFERNLEVALKPCGNVKLTVPVPPKFFDALFQIAQTAADAHEAQMRAEILGDTIVSESGKS